MKTWQPKTLEAKLNKLQSHSVLRFQNESEAARLKKEAEVHLRNGKQDLHDQYIGFSRSYAQSAEVNHVDIAMLTTDIMELYKDGCRDKE